MTRQETFRPRRVLPLTSLAVAALLLGACSSDEEVEVSVKPSYVGAVGSTRFDGSSDDLLTAGLGKTGLASAVAPTASTVPTGPELRRLAIYNSYRALVDMTSAGGYGVFYGPNVDAAGVAGSGEGKIAGTEYVAYSDDGTGARNVVLMVQVPGSFDPAQPCILTTCKWGFAPIQPSPQAIIASSPAVMPCT